MSEVVGRVSALWVFPVKSMRGVPVEDAGVQAGGLYGDRAWSVVDAVTGEAVTAKQAPSLRQVTARIVGDGAGDGSGDGSGDGMDVALDVPGHQPGLRGEDAHAALSAHLGRAVRLRRASVGAGFVDVAPVHLVSRGSIADAADHAEECDACDITEPRANVVLELDEPGAGERAWVGATLRLGDATLTVSRLPKHCLGVYADVTVAGHSRVGDPVELEPAPVAVRQE